MENNNIKTINKIFKDILNIHEKLKIKEFYSGFSNTSFIVWFTIKNNKITYHVKIPKIQKNNLKNEFYLYKKYKKNNLIYFDLNKGIIIKDWIEGTNVKKINTKILKHLVKEITHLHSLETSNDLKKINFLKNIDLIKNNIWKNKYKYLLNKYKLDKLVLSHNDINKKNFLFNKNEVILIDFEYSGVASAYFDYASIIFFEKIEIKSVLKFKKTLKYKKLFDYIFIVFIFSLSWSKAEKQTIDILEYEKKLNKLAKSYNFC